MADGNPAPLRKIEGQKTYLGRTMHAISYDEVHDEFMVPQQLGQAILTFRGDAKGEEPPVRMIQGSKTQLVAPDRLAYDSVHGEIYVPEGEKVLVFSREANGNAAPIRVLGGEGSSLRADAAAIDPIRNLLIVSGGSFRGGPKFEIYDRTAEGNAKPLRVIGGPKSGFRNLGGPFAVYPPKGWIIASDRGDGELVSDIAYVGIWSVEDNGDVPPRWKIGGPNGVLKMPRGIAVDGKNKSILVSDKRLNAVMTFYFPEFF
jgi:hypothetical protein